MRKQRIRSAQHRPGLHRALCLDIGDLGMRVNARVGAAGTRHRDVMVEEFLQSLLKFTLNGPKLWLNLPAVKPGTVVCKCQLEVPHSIGYSMWLGVRAMPGITATIITLNEEDRIAEALASLACCDEVIVVDSGSTDRTREIASGCGARVIEHSWEGYSRQKNFAAEQASHDWILSIDADERLSIELADDITSWKKNPLPPGEGGRAAGASGEGVETGHHPALRAPLSRGERAAAYSMARRAFYLGGWINHSGWYPDRKVRLYDRRRCRWEGDFVHETLKTDGAVDQLQGDLLHFPFNNWGDQMEKIDRYTDLAARAARDRGVRGSILSLVFAPPLAFMKSFFFRAGFLDGSRGMAIAYTGARYIFLREFRILRSWNWRWH